MEIGARLKEAREANNISLDSLQETTKIQKRYLLAIEEGNFHILPGKFYARAFIKEYANAVGLNPNDLLEEYKEEIPKTEEENDLQYTRIQRSRKENNSDKNSAIFSIIPTIIVVLLIIGIIFVAWYLIKETMSEDGSAPQEEPNDNITINYPDDNTEQNNNTEDEGTEATEDSNTEETGEDEQTEEGSESELSLVEEGSGSVPVSTFELNNPGEEVLLTIESEGYSWLDVKNGNDEIFYGKAFSEEEEPLEFDMTGEDRIYLNIGHAPDIKVQINGIELEYPVDPNEFVLQRIWINLNQETE
ncbi:helix-turn-helix domain-containing protein [Virgibacillus profundi]|uniref:Helix-turn-helix domain-containing protein n=1 Tax=Virgibacillus profundi TaxID=2024555 RepID=A0A2A2IFD7_9BACI|nr:helix-turn-helix domain-containing protein [Virgibacillus profundi]PAV30068.1 helix-turn-helix domain-containing protein [Virgibacillus profundi]PXY54241.1 helix-turn-helix domain-containing protein [Virgibacillus profundi]